MKRMLRAAAAAAAGIMTISTLTGCGAQGGKVKLDPANPTLVTIWHYYNGVQQQIFDELVDEFNDGVGREQGVIVEAYNKGNVNELSDTVIQSANKEVGADPLPTVFSAYSDCAAEVDQLGLVADLSPYMTQEEMDSYMDSYIREGELDSEGSLKLFPVAKSTEILLLNETEWSEFEADTGADKSKLATWEGIVELSREFYEWTDAQTPDVPDDGKSFFGRDAFANYMLVGSEQLGTELFHVEDGKAVPQVDEAAMRRLWDCYYVPYVNGWFGAYGKFRSDDIKTGQLFALVGSTSGAAYFPSEVTLEDGTTEPIECGVYSLPNFEGTEPYAVQQGAGLVVTKADEKTEYAATVFLKWITETDNNIRLSVSSGYMPVKKEANDPEVLAKALEDDGESELMREIVTTSAQVTSTYTLYTTRAFENGTEARKVVNESMPDAAVAAAERRDELVAGGMSREEAVAQLTGEQAFRDWLADFTAQLEAAVNG